MYKGKKIYVVYRAFYGDDFIEESLKSILPYADKIFVFWTDRAFAGIHTVEYNDEVYRIPKKIDNIVDKITDLKEEKIVLIKQHFSTNNNQFTIMYNNIIVPKYGSSDILMMMEIDHVFRKDQIEMALDEFIEREYSQATTEQWEVWKGFSHCVPQLCDPPLPDLKEYIAKVGISVPQFFSKYKIKSLKNPRFRLCSMFWNTEKIGVLPTTFMHCNSSQYPLNRLSARTHNLGFAWSYKTNFWKHIICIGIGKEIQDTVANIDWFQKKWVEWDYEKNNYQLEQSTSYEWTIPRAIPYDKNELPESIKNNLEKFINANYDENIK